MGRQRFTKPYMWLIIAVGAAIVLLSACRLPVARIDLRFLLLAIAAIVISARFSIQLPRININITVGDTFIFLVMLLYGGEAAVLLAAADGIASGWRISKTPRMILFTSAAVICSTFATALITNLLFGPTTALLQQNAPIAVIAFCVMALAQYIFNTGIFAIAQALKTDQPIWHTWYKHFLWISITYFAGATAAGVIASSISTVGFYAVIAVVPVIAIVYLTYNNYLGDIKASARQAELSERARAEAEHARAEVERGRAELAERHVEELSHYVAELERTGKALQESKEHFRHAAFHDSLTGLPNRALFTNHLQLTIEREKQCDDYLFAVLFLDLDRFKNINDSLGHTFGDKLLVAIAHRLESRLREGDTVARFGGDEFAVLLNNIKDFSDAIRVAEEIQQELSVPFDLNKHEAFTTASIGVALSSTKYEQPEDILRDADTAMYHAKEGGKARHEVFDNVMHARAVSLMRLENDLRRAVERQEFCVHYQPIIEMQTGKLAGFEALARWQHPERGLVSPAEFISVAEETGLIIPIGQWVLEEACRQMREWHQQSLANQTLTLSVNLSGKQLAQPDLIEQVEGILRKIGIDPRCIKLEITESVVMENAEAATAMLKRLRALGVRLSIDDFGTGYSSLSYLHRFPINTLKIDRSFISRMCQGDEDLEIVRTIVTLARNLAMDIVAEGVETEKQLAQLRALKCEYGQGYLFSKPLPSEAAGELIQKQQQHELFISRLAETGEPQGADLFESVLVM